MRFAGPVLFNLTLEYIMRKLPVTTHSTLMYKSVQVMEYADDINVLGAYHELNEAYTGLENQATIVG
jgi:sorting nexin-29